jgi:hypothetical protein
MEKLVLTPEIVVQSFNNTGLKPIVQGFGDGKTCGCLMTTIVKEFEPSGLVYDPASGDLNSNKVYETFEKIFGTPHGLLSGYDTPGIGFSDGDSKTFIDNYELGKACRLRLEELGMLE